MKIRFIGCLAFCLFLSPLAAAGAGETPPWAAPLATAEEHFSNGLEGREEEFLNALRSYEEALEKGAPEDFRISYNRGNALFLSGFPGEALWQYRRALFRRPGGARIRQNLNYVLEQSGAEPESWRTLDAVLFGSLYLWGYDRALYGGLFLFAGSWAVAAVGLLRKKRGLKRLFLLCLLLSLWNTGTVLAWRYRASLQGVVIPEDTVLRVGDSAAYDAVLSAPVPAGTAFRLLEERDGWLSVRLPDKSVGWVPAEDVRMVLDDPGDP